MADAIYVIYVTGELILGLVSLIGNLLVIFVVIKNRHLQTVTNSFVVSLAAADTLVGVVGTPCVLVAWHGMPANFYGCLAVNTIIIILTQISIFGLLAIAIERFVAIAYPFVYMEKFTMTTALIIIGIAWTSAILIGLVPMFGWNLGWHNNEVCAFTDIIDMDFMVYFNFFGCVLTPLLIIFILYAYIYRIVRAQLHEIAKLSVGPGSAEAEGDDKPNQKKQQFKREWKAAKWFAVVILIFTMCWLPLHIQNTISHLYGKLCFPCLIVAILLSHLNSAMNPVFYAYSNSKIKAAMQAVLPCIRNRVSDGGNATNTTQETY